MDKPEPSPQTGECVEADVSIVQHCVFTPRGTSIDVHVGGVYIGWVELFTHSSGIPNEIVERARLLLASPNPRPQHEFRKLLRDWQWGYDGNGCPSASLFSAEYDVIVTMRNGSVQIGGSPGAVAPWEIVAAVIHANGYNLG